MRKQGMFEVEERSTAAHQLYADEWLAQTTEGHKQYNYTAEQEQELVVTQLRQLKAGQKTHGRMLQHHSNQIEIAQKDAKTMCCRINGFFPDWPEQKDREAILKAMMVELGMEERDLVEVQGKCIGKQCRPISGTSSDL